MIAERRGLLLFAAANLLFLLVDVALAHASFFKSRAELVPIWISGTGGLLALLLAFLSGPWARALLWLDAAACILTGMAGLWFHAGAEELLRPSLQRLVYSAPIVAPLAYAGLGLLLLVAEHAREARTRGRLLQLLAGLGLLGNFVLCLLDHAQNGFWAEVEWLSVAGGAAGGLGLLRAASLRETTEAETRFLWGLLASMAAVGVLGATLHARADLLARGTLLERLEYGAPIFAPLLFADLAALGALGLVARRAKPA